MQIVCGKVEETVHPIIYQCEDLIRRTFELFGSVHLDESLLWKNLIPNLWEQMKGTCIWI